MKEIIDDFQPMFNLISEIVKPITLKDIYNPKHVIWNLHFTRKTIKRRKK